MENKPIFIFLTAADDGRGVNLTKKMIKAVLQDENNRTIISTFEEGELIVLEPIDWVSQMVEELAD